MRVTRNYMSALLNGNNSVNGSNSLLQRALSRSSKSRRSSRSSLLNQVNNGRNDIFGTGAIKDTANTQKLYYNMKYHAGQVADYADKLADTAKNSLFAKAKESGDTAEIVSTIKGFVSQYNSMMKNLHESGGRADNSYITQLNSVSGMKSWRLAVYAETMTEPLRLTIRSWRQRILIHLRTFGAAAQVFRHVQRHGQILWSLLQNVI